MHAEVIPEPELELAAAASATSTRGFGIATYGSGFDLTAYGRPARHPDRA